MTGGWLFAPAAFSDDGRMADITREGYLFEWELPEAPRCQTEWPSSATTSSGAATTTPTARRPRRPPPSRPESRTLSWKAPGGNFNCGKAGHYEIATSSHPIDGTDFAAANAFRPRT